VTDLAGTEAAPSGHHRITVVVGNPKAASRTRTVAEAVAQRAAEAAGLPTYTPTTIIELAEVAGSLFDWSSAEVKALAGTLSSSTLAVVASPTFKATYTGLLKAFLDWFPQTGLSGVTVVPLMLGGAPEHALAVEVHLRPLLVEIGATVPTRGLFILDNELEQLDARLDTWLEQAAPALAASVGAVAARQQASR
jgi:FMN reductase